MEGRDPIQAETRFRIIFFPLTFWYFDKCEWECLPDHSAGKECRTEIVNEKLFRNLEALVPTSPELTRRVNIMVIGLPKLMNPINGGDPSPVIKLKEVRVPQYGFAPQKLGIEMIDADGRRPNLIFSDRFLSLKTAFYTNTKILVQGALGYGPKPFVREQNNMLLLMQLGAFMRSGKDPVLKDVHPDTYTTEAPDVNATEAEVGEFSTTVAPTHDLGLGRLGNVTYSTLIECEDYDPEYSSVLQIVLPEGYVCDLDRTNDWKSHGIFNINVDENGFYKDYVVTELPDEKSGFWCAGLTNVCTYFFRKFVSLYPGQKYWIPLLVSNPITEMYRSQYNGINFYQIHFQWTSEFFEVSECVYDPDPVSHQRQMIWTKDVGLLSVAGPDPMGAVDTSERTMCDYYGALDGEDFNKQCTGSRLNKTSLADMLVKSDYYCAKNSFGQTERERTRFSKAGLSLLFDKQGVSFRDIIKEPTNHNAFLRGGLPMLENFLIPTHALAPPIDMGPLPANTFQKLYEVNAYTKTSTQLMYEQFWQRPMSTERRDAENEFWNRPPNKRLIPFSEETNLDFVGRIAVIAKMSEEIQYSERSGFSASYNYMVVSTTPAPFVRDTLVMGYTETTSTTALPLPSALFHGKGPNEVMLFFQSALLVENEAELVVDLPTGYNVQSECTGTELDGYYFANHGIAAKDVYEKAADDNIQKMLLRPYLLAASGSLLVEKLEYQGIVPDADLLLDPINNQPNGAYTPLTIGVRYKKPNAYGLSFFLQLHVDRTGGNLNTVATPNSINGVPFEEIGFVQWQLVDDANRLYLYSETYFPRTDIKRVVYPLSPAMVTSWKSVVVENAKALEAATINQLGVQEAGIESLGRDLFDVRPRVRGICEGSLAADSTGTQPYSRHYDVYYGGDTLLNRAILRSLGPLYAGELYALGLQMTNPDFKKEYIEKVWRANFQKEHQALLANTSFHKANTMIESGTLVNSLGYPGRIQEQKLKMYVRDALGFVQGTHSRSIFQNPDRRGTDESFLNVFPFEHGWQLFQYEWPRRAVVLDFYSAVDGKLLTTSTDSSGLEVRDELNLKDPPDSTHYEIKQTDTQNYDIYLLHPVYDVSKLILPSFAILGTILKAKIRFLIPPHLVLLDRIHQIFFHQEAILAAGYFASGYDRTRFLELQTLYTKIWNTTETLPGSWFHLMHDVVNSMDLQYCSNGARTLEHVHQEAVLYQQQQAAIAAAIAANPDLATTTTTTSTTTVPAGVAQNFPCVNMQELVRQYYYYFQEQSGARLFGYRPRLEDDAIASGGSENNTEQITVEEKYPRLLDAAPLLGSPVSNLTDPPFDHFFKLHTNMRIIAPKFYEFYFLTSTHSFTNNFNGRVRNGRSSRYAAGYGVKPSNELQFEEFQVSTKYLYEAELMVQTPEYTSTPRSALAFKFELGYKPLDAYLTQIEGSTSITTYTVSTTSLYYEPAKHVYLESVAALSMNAPKLQVIYDASVRSLDNRIGVSGNLMILSMRTTTVLNEGNGFQFSGVSTATIGLKLLCSPEGLSGIDVDDYKCVSTNPDPGNPRMQLTLTTGPHPPGLYSFKITATNPTVTYDTRSTGVFFELGTYDFGGTSRRTRRLVEKLKAEKRILGAEEAPAGVVESRSIGRTASSLLPSSSAGSASGTPTASATTSIATSPSAASPAMLPTPLWMEQQNEREEKRSLSLLVDKLLPKEQLETATEGLFTKLPRDPFPLTELQKFRTFLLQREVKAGRMMLQKSSGAAASLPEDVDISDEVDSFLLETMTNPESDPLDALDFSRKEDAKMSESRRNDPLASPASSSAQVVTAPAKDEDILFHPDFVTYLKKRRRELSSVRTVDKPMVVGLSPHPAIFAVKTMASFFWVSGGDANPDYLNFLGKDDRPQKNTKVFFAFKLADTLPRREQVKMVLKAPEGFIFDAKCMIDLQPVFRKGYKSAALTHRYLVRRQYTQSRSYGTTTSTTTTTTGPRYGPQLLNPPPRFSTYHNYAENQFQTVDLPVPPPYDRTDGVPSAITEYLANLTRSALEQAEQDQLSFDGQIRSARFSMSTEEQDNQWGIKVDSCTGNGAEASIMFSPNADYSYMLKKNMLYYFGIWVTNPVVASKYGWFAMDFETETSARVEAYPIRTMSRAQLFPISEAYAPLPSDATARTASNIRVTFTPVTPITPLFEYVPTQTGRRLSGRSADTFQSQDFERRIDARRPPASRERNAASKINLVEHQLEDGYHSSNTVQVGEPRLFEGGDASTSGGRKNKHQHGITSFQEEIQFGESATLEAADDRDQSQTTEVVEDLRSLQGQTFAEGMVLTGSSVEVVAPLGFEFVARIGTECSGFRFYPADNILDAFYEGEHVRCSVAGQKIKVVFFKKGLESSVSYVLAADIMNADRSKANILESASWIIQTYQYQDTNVEDGLMGNLVAMDEVLIPTYAMNNYVERWSVNNYWERQKGRELIEELYFRMKFFGHVQTGQILYMEAPQGFELHTLDAEMNAPVNQLEHGVQPCFGFSYTGQYPFFYTTPDPICGCYERNLQTEEPLSYLRNYDDVRSTTTTTPPPVNANECPRIESKTGRVRQCFMRINVFERNPAVWQAALNDPDRAVIQFRLKTYNPEETPFVTRNFWNIWQYEPSDLFLRSRLDAFRKDVTDGRVTENHIFLPGDAPRVFQDAAESSRILRKAGAVSGEQSTGDITGSTATTSTLEKCGRSGGCGASTEGNNFGSDDSVDLPSDVAFQTSSTLFDENMLTSLRQGKRKTLGTCDENEIFAEDSKTDNVKTATNMLRKKKNPFKIWPSENTRTHVVRERPNESDSRKFSQVGEDSNVDTKKKRKLQVFTPRYQSSGEAADLILVPYQNDGQPDNGVSPQRFSIYDDNWLLMKPRLNTAEMVPPLHQLVVESIYRAYRATGATAAGTTQDAISNSNEWQLLVTDGYLGIQSSSVYPSWEIRSQLIQPHFANVGIAARTGALTDLLLQFTPLHEANVCVVRIREPKEFSFNKTTAYMNVTKVPVLVEKKKEEVLIELDQERNRMNQFGKKLTAVQHQRLSDKTFHLAYHSMFTYHQVPLDQQNPRSPSYIAENYFLEPTLKYNRTNLAPTVFYPLFYERRNVSNTFQPMQNEEQWIPLPHHYDSRLAPSQLILVNCSLCPQQRTQILLKNATTGNYTEGMRVSLISYFYHPQRTDQDFYQYVTGYSEGLDEMLDYTQETMTAFERPGRAPLMDMKNEVAVAGYVHVKGIPILLGEDTVRCAEGVVGELPPGALANTTTTTTSTTFLDVPEGADPVEYQVAQERLALSGEALLDYYARSSYQIITQYQELDRIRSLQNDPFRVRTLPDGTRLGGYNNANTRFSPKTPSHQCDSMLKLFEPQLYEPSRMTFVTRFQRQLYSGGRIRVQSVEDMGQFVPDPIARDDIFYQEQLEKNNEPWELLYTYPYQPKVFRCRPTTNMQFDDRDQYDAWKAQTDPDKLCPPELRQEHVILKTAETSHTADRLVERVETTPSYGFASRKTMSRRRRSIDLTMLNVQETRATYTGTDIKLLVGTAEQRDFDIKPQFNFDTSGGIPVGLEVTAVALVEDPLLANPAQRAGVQPHRDRLVSMISASGMHHVLAKSVLTPDTIENHAVSLQQLFDGVIYPITLIFWGERNVLKDEKQVSELAETFIDPTTGQSVKIWDTDMEIDDYIVFQLWVMPGKFDSYLRIESELYNNTRSTFMLSTTNDASYYMNATEMKLTYPLPTEIVAGRKMGERAPPMSVVPLEISVSLYNTDRNQYFENDFLSGNRTWIDILKPPLYDDMRLWNRMVMKLIFGDEIFITITNNEMTTNIITDFVVKEVMLKNVWLQNNLLLDEYYPMTDYLSDENKAWIVQQLNAGSGVASGAIMSDTGGSGGGSGTVYSPFGQIVVQNTTTLPPYNYTCQPHIWAHVLQVCDAECRALVSGMRDTAGKKPPLAAPYRNCDNYCKAQQGGYECTLAAEERADPNTGLPSCNIQGEYSCDFDFSLYTDDVICQCRPTTTTTTTPPPPPHPVPKVVVTHMDFILPKDYRFYGTVISKFVGTGGMRNWGSMLFPYEPDANPPLFPPPMPIQKTINTPPENPEDNRWFVRTRRMWNEFVVTSVNPNTQVQTGEYQLMSLVTGWGVVHGFPLAELSRTSVVYPVLPNLVDADVHAGFELAYRVVTFAHSLIISAPRGFLLQCAPPSVPSPQAQTCTTDSSGVENCQSDYRCNTCIDIVRSRLLFAKDAETDNTGFNLAPGAANSANGLITDPILALFGQALQSNTDPDTGECYDPFTMFTTQEALDENFGQFAFYVNMSVKGLILSQQQIGDVELLDKAVPFSFFLKLRTSSDTRTALEIRDDQMQSLDPNNPDTYNGEWDFRIHDLDNITVDAKFDIPNPHFVTGLPMEAPKLKMQFPEFNVRDAGSWDKWKSTITVSFATRNPIYFIDETSRFKAILIVLPQMFEHNIQEPSEFKSLNQKFPTAMNQEWRQYRASKRYVVVLIEAIGIEELKLDVDTYSWQFPIKVPSRLWPIDTTFQLILCRNYNPCGWPMPAEDYVVRFPIYGPSREEYLRLIDLDDTVYYRGAAAGKLSGRSSVSVTTMLASLFAVWCLFTSIGTVSGRDGERRKKWLI
ncbi:unnamed protein product [Amoebophrya sp. A120]|nr:unnamed protein product [Amoebophrya sp. A120]|eukprot:GSA120T00024975001.1